MGLLFVVLDYESFSSKRGRTLYQRGVTDWSVSLASFCVSVLELVFCWMKITPPEPMYWYHEKKPCFAATPKIKKFFKKRETKRTFDFIIYLGIYYTIIINTPTPD